MAKNKNKKKANDTEFSEEVIAKNVKHTAAGAANESTNANSKY